MTLITVMKFNENEGAILADEQSSTSSRKYDFAEKTHQLILDAELGSDTEKPNHGVILYGGSGSADFLYEAVTRISHKAGPDVRSTAEAVRIMSQVMTILKRENIQAYFNSQFGITEEDLQRGYKTTSQGKVEFDPAFKENAWRTFNSDTHFQQMISGCFAILAGDAEGIELYEVSTALARPSLCARPYICIGSGSDIADGELSSFIEAMPRNERKKILPSQGLAAMLYAADRASKKNHGVGGTPNITILKDQRITTLCEESSRLASEIVLANKRGYVQDGFTSDALEALVNADGLAMEWNARMMAEAGDKKDSMLLMFRGYKT